MKSAPARPARSNAARTRGETARSHPQPVRHRKTGAGGHRTRSRQTGRAEAGRASRRARHRRPRHRLRLVQPPRSRRLPFMIAAFLIVGTLVVGVASLQAVVSQGSFRMQELTKRNLELEEEYGRLKLQVAELSAPGRIATQARRLGFRVPTGVNPLTVRGAVPVRAGTGTLGQPVFSLKGALEHDP